MGLSNKKVLVYDRGLYTFFAQKLGESFGKVYYFMPESDPFPKSNLEQIATELPEVERVYNFWGLLDKCDAILFPDSYDKELQIWLKSKRYNVFGSLGSEELETDKGLLYDILDREGKPVAKTDVIKGIDNLENFLQDKSDKWLKCGRYRGDFDSVHFQSMKHFKPWFADIRQRLGFACRDIEIVVQSPIKSVCEAGADTFCLNGEFAKNPLVGYEIKDRGYIGAILPDRPKIISDIDDALKPSLKKMGIQGHYSNEIRITEKGKAFYIDLTPRLPSPPSELMCEIYSNYAEIIFDLANGKMPEPKQTKKYGAELILVSEWAERNELCVEFPKELKSKVKLKAHMGSSSGEYYCIPNSNYGFFGAVIGLGNTIDEAVEDCLVSARQIKCNDLTIDDGVFDKALDAIKKGRRFGINI